MVEPYSAGVHVSAIGLPRQIPVPAQKFSATPDCLFKMEVLKTMKWIVVHKGAHGPVPCNHFAGESDDAAQLHATDIGRFRIASDLYLVHAENSTTAVR